MPVKVDPGRKSDLVSRSGMEDESGFSSLYLFRPAHSCPTRMQVTYQKLLE